MRNGRFVFLWFLNPGKKTVTVLPNAFHFFKNWNIWENLAYVMASNKENTIFADSHLLNFLSFSQCSKTVQ